MIKVQPYNETHVKIACSDYGVLQELAEYFTFFAPNYEHQPKFKSGLWDGRIRLLNMRSKLIFKGLVLNIKKFAESHGYEITIDPSLNWTSEVTEEAAKQFMESLNLPDKITFRDYQFTAIAHSFGNQRCILESATSSGKSLLFYTNIRHHVNAGRKVLLIVPSVGLVKQMNSDFIDYSTKNGWDVPTHCHTLFAGKERVFDASVIISTWQTLSSMIKSDEKNFKILVDSIDVILGDEAHQQKSVETVKILESFTKTAWRIGMTGTLDGVKVNELTLTGLFGPPVKIVSSRELMDEGHATPVDIRVLVLKHPEEYRKAFHKMKYAEEQNLIMGNPVRNKFIAKLAVSCKGNTLVIFNQIKKHGDLIRAEVMKLVQPGRNVYYLTGKMDADERERIRQIVETEADAIILAVSTLISTGTNIPSIHNTINTLSGKSNIRIRQTIGRGIRLKDGKTISKYFDIADDYSYKSWTNTTMNHLDERIKIYARENFDMKVTNVDLKY
jgi:superfamily II DNA or RNA helicase